MDSFYFKRQKSINLFIIIIIIWFIAILLIFFFYQYHKSFHCYGEIVQNEYYNLIVPIEKEKISDLTNQLIIYYKLRECNIYKINKGEYLSYYEVYFKCDLSSEELANNYIFDIQIYSKKTTLYQNIKNNFKKGLQL